MGLKDVLKPKPMPVPREPRPKGSQKGVVRRGGKGK